MSGTINLADDEYLRRELDKQSCVRLMRQSDIPPILKAETEQFISRNVLPDCGKVPPNCLKAFMIKTAQRMGLGNLIPNIQSLFRSKVGYNGYYLDGGKLFHVELSDNTR